MPNLARRATEINPSPTIAMNARAAEMKRLGKDIIPLSLGEPDFHTPDNIKAAGIAAIERNFTKYTNADGYAPLRKAIAEKLRRDNNAEYTPEQVVVGSGAKIVILSAILNIVNPGDEVVIPTPYWVTYPDHVEMAGGKSVFAPCGESTASSHPGRRPSSSIHQTIRLAQSIPPTRFGRWPQCWPNIRTSGL
jgi:aspartate aminotransferase